MQIIQYLKRLAENEHVLQILNKNLNVFPDRRYPFQNYIGVNFNESRILGLKFYFAFYEPVSEELASVFLDDLTDFRNYIKYWVPQHQRDIKNTGFSFSLKTDEDFNITKGFHFRFPYNAEVFPPTKAFPMDPASLMNVGINFEYKNGKRLVKHYYYFDKEYNKQRFAVRFNEPFLCGSDLIEYTESEGFNKLIAWDFSENPVYGHFLKHQNQLPIVKDLYELLNKDFGYYNKAWNGLYEGKNIYSRYFLNYHTEDGSTKFPGDRSENFQVFTIKDFLKKIKEI